MSVEQYQRTVNSLDKEIADLEKKKAEAQEASGEQPVIEEKKEEAPTSEDSSKN